MQRFPGQHVFYSFTGRMNPQRPFKKLVASLKGRITRQFKDTFDSDDIKYLHKAVESLFHWYYEPLRHITWSRYKCEIAIPRLYNTGIRIRLFIYTTLGHELVIEGVETGLKTIQTIERRGFYDTMYFKGFNSSFDASITHILRVYATHHISRIFPISPRNIEINDIGPAGSVIRQKTKYYV